MSTLSLKATIAIFGLFSLAPALASAQGFQQTNLVTDDQSVNSAALTDPLLKNVWGVSYSGAGAFWVSNNGSGTSTLYNVAAATNAPKLNPLIVDIPGDGSVTGQVFNGTSGFNADPFLFVSEDGTVSGWKPGLNSNNRISTQVFQTGSSANVYKGSAIASVGGHTYLYAANFRAGTIDALGGDAAAPALSGAFSDPAVPAGYAPFNIQNLKGTLYVTYAKQDAARHDEEDGAGNGYIAAFDTSGKLISHLVSGGKLNAPWGLALAPANFGKYAGELLAGNFGDGRIGAYDPLTGAFAGQLTDEFNNPIAIDGLWGLTIGNGGQAGSASDIYFTAGPDGEKHGLFGSISAVPEPGQISLFAATLCAASVGLLKKRRRG